MTADTQKLRELIAAVPTGWQMNAAQMDEHEECALVGSISDDEFYPIMTVDTGLYEQHDDALPIAQYYAAVEPKVVNALLAELERKDAEVARLREALKIADKFCGSLTADECPDSVHIPIRAALSHSQADPTGVSA